MNLFPGTLCQQAPGFFSNRTDAVQHLSRPMKPQAFPFSLPAGLGPKFSELLGKAIILGLRPENMEIGPGKDTVRERWTFKARILAV
jgi:hypothetical protein